MDDEYPSITLNHHILDNEEVNLQVDTSNSFPSTSQVDKETATLIASDALSLSKKDQEKIITLSNIGNWKPIIILSENGKDYHMLASPKTIECILTDQPTGVWKLPIPNGLETQDSI